MIEKIKSEDAFFDVIIIGGGITGACVARDASLRGLSVCLLEKQDFASGTSSMTSKMVHGGLRYLMNYEFRLVREAALERKIVVETAPHLAEPMKFMVPLYNWNRETPFLLRLGLFGYYILSLPKPIGRHKMLSKTKIVQRMPIMENDNIVGGAEYYDVKSDDSRLTLTNALSAMASGAVALNYFKAVSWEGGKNAEDEVMVNAVDELTGDSYTIKGDSLVISGGPWTDHIEDTGKNFEGKAKLRLTRGTHIMIDQKMDLPYSSLLINHDERPIFIVPRINNKILAGTTDVDYKGHPDDIMPTKEDVEYILKGCNEIFPTANFKEEDILSSFCGVRPLVYKEGVSEGEVSRDHTIHLQGNVITVLGGKLTTARVMAKQVVDRLVKKVFELSTRNYRCMTHQLPLFAGEIDDWQEYYAEHKKRIKEDYNLSEDTADMLVRWYGSELPYFEIILKEYGTQPLEESNIWLEAQVIYSCRVEHIQKPIDFLRRRTPIMLERNNGSQMLDKIADLMQKELKWDDNLKTKMIEETKLYIQKFVAVPRDN